MILIRSKIKIFKKSKKRNIKSKVLFSFLVVLFLTCFLLKLLNKTVIPFVRSYSILEVERVIKIIINDSINKYKINDQMYNEMTNIIKNNNDEIVTIDLKNSILTKNLYDINKDINNKIYKLKNNEKIAGLTNFINNDFVYKIPYGAISGDSLTSRIGQKIPVKISVNAIVNSEYKIEIIEYGINNALLKILLDVEIQSKILLPFVTENIVVSQKVPVIIKLIQGKVPSIYGYSYDKTLSS